MLLGVESVGALVLRLLAIERPAARDPPRREHWPVVWCDVVVWCGVMWCGAVCVCVCVCVRVCVDHRSSLLVALPGYVKA